MPEPSWPPSTGNHSSMPNSSSASLGGTMSPVSTCSSEWHSPANAVRTRTSPAFGSPSSNSSTLQSWPTSWTIAPLTFMFASPLYLSNVGVGPACHDGGMRAVRVGDLQGLIDQGTAAFLGIPYAAPPFGEHRFTAPAPVVPWDGVRSCVAYGPTAPQPHRQFTLVPEPVMDGADCLNLNVFAPEAAADLPVLVWIHGGGFTAGCNASPWY